MSDRCVLTQIYYPVAPARELAAPSDLTTAKVLPFEFKGVELQYDSYRGQAVRRGARVHDSGVAGNEAAQWCACRGQCMVHKRSDMGTWMQLTGMFDCLCHASALHLPWSARNFFYGI